MNDLLVHQMTLNLINVNRKTLMLWKQHNDMLRKNRNKNQIVSIEDRLRSLGYYSIKKKLYSMIPENDYKYGKSFYKLKSLIDNNEF